MGRVEFPWPEDFVQDTVEPEQPHNRGAQHGGTVNFKDNPELLFDLIISYTKHSTIEIYNSKVRQFLIRCKTRHCHFQSLSVYKIGQ